MEKNITTIATHNGLFHTDDVVGVAIVRALFPEASVVRTRNATAIAAADIAIDVGGGEFDHHQRGGNGTRDTGVPYAAAGLIWKFFGEKFVESFGFDCDPSEVARYIDLEFISLVDSVDCGGVVPSPDGWGFSGVISGFNPSWHENADEAGRNEAFMAAVAVATLVLGNKVKEVAGRLMARDEVVGSVAVAAFSGSRVIELDRFLPWQKVVGDYEPASEMLFVVFPSFKGYNVQCIPTGLPDRSSRKLLPEAWGGLQAAELSALTGVEDAQFCHPGGFIAGADTREGALRLAALAVEA